jgi:4-amino-4-deoxy-L-arabinose transferase-like glycosyltransferase
MKLPSSLTRSTAAPTLLIFLLALVPRLIGLGRFVTFDEPVWVFRTLLFWRAVADGRWADTAVAAHPGVLTMILGGAGIGLKQLADPAPVERAWALAATLPGLRATDDAALQVLGPLLADATWPVALAQALGIALCYVLAARAFSRSVALVFAALLALDPFAIGLARVLHVDGLQAICGAVALLAAAAYLRTGSRSVLALSGAAAALTVLAKAPGAAIALWALPIVLLRGPGWRQRAIDAGIWGSAGLLTALCLWPALWVDPVGTLAAALSGGERYAERAIDTAHFFLGQAVEAPGVLFYPVAGFFRAEPWLVLGLLLAPLAWRSGWRRERRAWLGAILLALGYAALLSLSPKKFDRYLLPTWPLWALASALGYRAFLRWRRWPVRRAALAGLAMVVVQIALLASTHPYYLAWFSPLAGGLRGAVAVLPVGWGEGLEQVAAFANGDAPARDPAPIPRGPSPLMASTVAGLAPLSGNSVLPMDQANLPRVDYIVRYIADTQAPTPDWLATTLAQTPVFTATVRGQPYAWLYPNVEMKSLADRVRVDPAPIGVSQSDYLFRNAGAFSLLHDPAEAEREMAGLTDPELWLETSPLSPSPGQAAAEFWMASHADRLGRLETPHTVLTRYRFAEDGAGRATALTSLTLQGLRFGDHARIAGASWSEGPLGWTRALGTRLDWAGLAAEEGDLTAFLHLTDAQGRLWGQVDQPILALADDPVWEDALNDDPFAPVEPAPILPFDPADAADAGRQDLLLYAWPGTPPGQYQAWLGVYRSGDGTRLPIQAGNLGLQVDAERVLLGDVTVARSPVQPSVEDLAIPIPLDAEMGGVRLIGAALPGSPRRIGDTATLSLFWEIADPAALATTGLRLELVTEAGEDAPASAPVHLLAEPLCVSPCAWQTGDRLRTQHTIRVPEGVAPGRYGIDAVLVPGDFKAPLGVIEIAP